MQLISGALNPYAAHQEKQEHARFLGERPMLVPGVIHAQCGVDWDAIRVLPAIGERTLKALGPDIGPVVASTYAGHWTFLIDRGGADGWHLPGVRLLRRNTTIELPLTPACIHTRDVRWVVPPGGRTEPDQFYRALGGTPASPPARPPAPGKKRSAKKSPAGARGST
ncbi:hypothetical protein ABT104_00750 [Streptomyces mobaraensis]|uniref:hypothetical protein n=1 Tax=Streptomyces mobaraensis TaxID=35621 RepID=UPI00331BB75A